MVRVKKRPREGHTRPLGEPPYKAQLARVHAVKRCPEAVTPPRPPRRPRATRESRECWENTADRHWVTGVGWKPGPKPAAGESRRRRAPTRGHEITRVADDLVPFGFLPKRAKPTPNYRIA